jgi:putative MATE family efflux protein
MHRTDALGSEKISKLLARFAVPSIFSLVLHAVYNVVDRIFIGQGVGPSGLAGVALSFPILLILFGICLLFSSGGASLISLKLGEKKQHEAERVLGNIFTLITGTGVLLTFLGVYYCKDVLILFQVPEEILPYAHDYIGTIFMGSLLFLFGFSLTFIIRAEGNPLYSTLIIVAGTLANVALDWLFIFHFDMGTRGAALATVIAEGLVAFLGVLYIARKKGLLHIHRKNLLLHKDTVKELTLLGMSPAIMDVVASLQLSIFNAQLVKYGGTLAVAAMGIVFAVGSLMMLFTFGMAAGMQPIIGFNYGAKNYKRSQHTFFYAAGVTVCVSIGFVGLIQFQAKNLVGLFCSNDPDLLALGVRGMKTYLLFIPFANLSILGARYFQSIGKGWKSMFVGMTRQLLIFIPVLYFLSTRYEISGIFWTGPVTDGLAVLFTCTILFYELRKTPHPKFVSDL